MRHDLPPPTRKIPRLQPLVAVPPPFQVRLRLSVCIQLPVDMVIPNIVNGLFYIKIVLQMTCKTSQTRSLRSAEVVNVPIRLVGPAKSVNQEPHTIPRPKVIPPLPPLTVYMNRVFTPPPLSPKKAPGLRRYRSKSSTILREPSFR